MSRTTTFVNEDGTTIRTADVAESHFDPSRHVWTRPDGEPYRNQYAASDERYRHLVENAMAWCAGTLPEGWTDWESHNADGVWTYPNGGAYTGDGREPAAALRQAHDLIALAKITPESAEEHAEINAMADNAGDDPTGGGLVSV